MKERMYSEYYNCYYDVDFDDCYYDEYDISNAFMICSEDMYEETISKLQKYWVNTDGLTKEEKHQKAVENVGDGRTASCNFIFSKKWFEEGEPVLNKYGRIEYKFGNRSDGRFPYRMFWDSPVPSKKNTKVITLEEFEDWVAKNPDCDDWEYYQHLPNCGCNWDEYEHSRKGERVGKNREKTDKKHKQYVLVKVNTGTKKNPEYEVEKLPYVIAKNMYGKNVYRYIIEYLDEYCNDEI